MNRERKKDRDFKIVRGCRGKKGMVCWGGRGKNLEKIGIDWSRGWKMGGIFLLCLFFCIGCGKRAGDESQEEIKSRVERAFAITEESSIQEDFEYFGLEVKPGYDTLALTKVCSMINDGNVFYIYFNMPKDTEKETYRIDRLVMNGITYIPEFLEVDEYYQKYVLYNGDISPEQKYEITEIGYCNQLDFMDRYTHYQNQICYMGMDEEAYRFRLEYQNQVILQGKLFECIYQFNKENGTFRDLWYKITDNTGKMDEDKRSFFYFAFNCFDKDRGIPFTPEDILQVDVEYNELHYQYQGKEKDGISGIEPEVLHREEAVTPDEVTVTAKESKRSNGFFYQYQTINRLADADLEQNVSEEKSAVLQLAANSYDWAISFGKKDGYRYAMNDTWFSHDYEYTGIEEFRTIRVTYMFEGHTYTVNTDSLIGEKIVTLPEIVPENQNTWTKTAAKWLLRAAAVLCLLVLVKLGIKVWIFWRKSKNKSKSRSKGKDIDIDENTKEKP